MDDEKVIELARPKSLIDMIDGAAEDTPRRADGKRGGETEPLPSLDRLTPLPRPGDPYAAAHARAANKPVLTLHLVMADGSVRGLSYALLETVDLVPDGAGQGMIIVAVFGGTSGTQEVRIVGRNLDSLYTYLGHRRVWWIRQIPAGRDFLASDVAVVTGIVIRMETT